MILERPIDTDRHYYYVMGWTADTKLNAPKYKKRFNIYDDAIDFYNEIYHDCDLVEMFEYIDGKRKVITPEQEVVKMFDLEHFENKTGLSLRKMDSLYGESYRVVSGQRYSTIKRIVEKYNKENSLSLSCYNDYTKDETIIKA